MTLKTALSLLLPGLAAPSLSAATLFLDDFNSSGAAGDTPSGWTFLDAPDTGDHASIGLRPDADSSGGVAVQTMDDTGFFLNGGRSAIFSYNVGTMVEGEEYTFTVWRAAAGSSYNVSAAYLSTTAPTGYNPADKLGGNATGTGTTSGSWSELELTYVATASDAGKDLWVNLQSSRNVSTAVVAWDNVSVVTAVPEPTTSALFGLAGLGFILRRRR